MEPRALQTLVSDYFNSRSYGSVILLQDLGSSFTNPDDE